MEEDKDKFTPLEKMSQDDPVAGTSKETTDDISKETELEEEMDMEDNSGEEYSEEQEKLVKKRGPVTAKLPAHLKGLMGEANLRFARGNLKYFTRQISNLNTCLI